MGKKSTTQKTSERAFVTVKLKDRMAAVPEVKDGMVGELTVAEYVNGLTEGKLVEQVISIGKQFKEFKDFFAAHVDWIVELRLRIPARGSACKINLVDADGNSKLLTWSEFCLEVFGVSARWVSKLITDYQGMQEFPDIDKEDEEEESEEGEKKEKDRNPSADEVMQEYEVKLDRIETQADNLRLEIGNLITKIEKYKNQMPKEVLDAAMACKLRVVPPKVADAMDTADEHFESIGTDELLDQLKNVTPNSVEDDA